VLPPLHSLDGHYRSWAKLWHAAKEIREWCTDGFLVSQRQNQRLEGGFQQGSAICATACGSRERSDQARWQKYKVAQCLVWHLNAEGKILHVVRQYLDTGGA
jgi:hypothetical protein